MDNFKETIMVNSLRNNPTKVTISNIDEFFKELSIVSLSYYVNKLEDAIIDSKIDNIHTQTLLDYLTTKLLF